MTFEDILEDTALRLISIAAIDDYEIKAEVSVQDYEPIAIHVNALIDWGLPEATEFDVELWLGDMQVELDDLHDEYLAKEIYNNIKSFAP